MHALLVVVPEARVDRQRIELAPEQREKKNFQYTQAIGQPGEGGQAVRRTWQFAAVDPSTEATMSRPSGPVTVLRTSGWPMVKRVPVASRPKARPRTVGVCTTRPSLTCRWTGRPDGRK